MSKAVKLRGKTYNYSCQGLERPGRVGDAINGDQVRVLQDKKVLKQFHNVDPVNAMNGA